MKKVNLDPEKCIVNKNKGHYNTIWSRKYWIYLHPDCSQSFIDMKVARAFVVKTNSFLTLKLYEMNELSIEIYAHYRRNWFYFDNESNKIRQELIGIEKGFETIINNSSHSGGSHMVFRLFDCIINSFVFIIDTLQELHKNKGHWADLRILESWKNRLRYMKNEIFTFGSTNLQDENE